MRKQLAFFFLILFSLNSYSQADSLLIFSNPKSSISITALGTGIYGSAGYRKIIKEYKKSFLEGGVAASYFRGPSIAYEIFDYFGKGNNHLVLGTGYYFSLHLKSTNKIYSEFKNVMASYPNFTIGYSYWNPTKRLSYTILLYPLMNYSGGNLNPGWLGFSASYHFISKGQLSNPENSTIQNDNSKHIFFGNETGIGIGKASLTRIGESNGVSFNSNFYLKYYFSFFYLKAFTGISYLNVLEVESNYKYKIFNSNPGFLNLGIGAGIIALSKDNLKLETGLDVGNYFPLNNLQIKPINLPYQLNNNLDFFLVNPKYGLFNSYRPFIISPQLSLIRKFTNRIEAGINVRYNINYYQFASHSAYNLDYAFMYALESNQFYIGFNIQYNLTGLK